MTTARSRLVSVALPRGFSGSSRAVLYALMLGFVMLDSSSVHSENVQDPSRDTESRAQVDRHSPGARFVKLALQLANLPGHGDEVDSYFGPQSLRPAPTEQPATVDTLTAEAANLLHQVEQLHPIGTSSALASSAPASRPPSAWAPSTPSSSEEASPTDPSRLLGQLRSFVALTQFIEAPHQWTLQQEAHEIFAMSIPTPDQAATDRALAALNKALPGKGPLGPRLEDFQSQFVVPPERRQMVFERALQECRRRTLAHWSLPANERVDVDWTSAVPAAWHRYQGDFHSTLQINPDAVALIGSAIDVACHEAYPGHHTQFVLMERNAGPAGLPIEDKIVLLRSPASVLREGAANFGVELAFPLRERVAFDREILFPLAGLDPALAERYEAVHHWIDVLSSAVPAILAAYRDGRHSYGEAASELVTDAQILEPAPLLQFVDRYGAYALGYTAARDRVREAVLAQARGSSNQESRWSALRQIVAELQTSVL